MAKNIQMKIRDGEAWEEIYPRTRAEVVIGLDGAIADQVDAEIGAQLDTKVDKVTGKGLSTEDYTSGEKGKLSGIAAGAYNYTHPANHPPSIITQDANNRFMTDSERNKLSGIAAGAQVNAVASVAGKTGAVTLAKADVGLSNVDNTSDANKPVSSATQTALNAKANLASPALTGNPTAPTQAVTNSSTRLATTAFVKNQGYSKIALSATAPTDVNVDIWYEELS